MRAGEVARPSRDFYPQFEEAASLKRCPDTNQEPSDSTGSTCSVVTANNHPLEDDQHRIVAKFFVQEKHMGALKAVRNVIGTAGLMLFGYVLVMSLKDSARYLRISSM
jgi:hypothetical protein